jgi:hypothetical protein
MATRQIMLKSTVFFFRLWSVLALLPNLKKLELSSLDLGHPADATPLEPVTHFIMSEHTVAEV